MYAHDLYFAKKWPQLPSSQTYLHELSFFARKCELMSLDALMASPFCAEATSALPGAFDLTGIPLCLVKGERYSASSIQVPAGCADTCMPRWSDSSFTAAKPVALPLRWREVFGETKVPFSGKSGGSLSTGSIPSPFMHLWDRCTTSSICIG